MESLVLAAVLAECREWIGATVQGIGVFPDSPRWLLGFRGGGLVIDLAGSDPALYRSAAGPLHRQAAGLAGTLADRLTGAKATAFEQSGLNRLACLSFEKRDRFGDPVTTRLIVELFGSWGNLIVAESGPEGDRIIDRLRPDRRQVGARPLERGNLYELPRRTRADLALDGPEALAARLAAAPRPAGMEEWRRRFEESVEGAGSAAARDVIARTAAPLAAGPLVETWASLVKRASAGGEAWLVISPGAVRPRVMVYPPLPAAGEAVISCAGASAAVEAARSATLAAAGTGGTTGSVPHASFELSRLIGRRVEKAARLKARLEAELARRQDGELDRLRAETLLAHGGQVGSGRSEVVLPSPRGNGDVTVPLDPALSIAENARRYYREARKAALAAVELPARIAAADAEVRRAGAWLTRLKQLAAGDEAGIEELRAEVEGRAPRARVGAGRAAGAPGRRPPGPAERRGDHAAHPGSSSKDRAPASLQPRRYDLPGGWILLVGRSQAGNDYLTHRLAAPHDLWFHVHGASGSHVILKAPDRKAQPDKSLILTAAALAALNSKARHASRVPVIYAEKRHVRKPRGSKPGLAAVTNEKSLMVRPGEPAGARGESSGGSAA